MQLQLSLLGVLGVLALAAPTSTSLVAPPPPSALPPLLGPTRLRTDHLPSPALGTSLQPRLMFAAPGLAGLHGRGLELCAFRVWVRRDDGPADSDVVFDSGMVSAARLPEGGVRCNTTLAPGRRYTWNAQWMGRSNGSCNCSLTSALAASPAVFVTGLRSPAPDPDPWSGAQWLGGGGHSELRTTIDKHWTNLTSALLFIAAPGGVVVHLNDTLLQGPGRDDVGLAPWTDFTRSMPHLTLDLTSELQLHGKHTLARNSTTTTNTTTSSISSTATTTTSWELRISLGCGGWCESESPAWQHSHRTIHTPDGALPLARVVLVLRNGAAGVVQRIVSTPTVFASRQGPIMGDPWYGAVMDWRVAATGRPWTQPARAVGADTVQLDIPAAIRPLAVPIGRRLETIAAASVQPCGLGCHLYNFSAILVGQAEVTAAAVTTRGAGNLSLEYCEVMADAATGRCVRMSAGFLQRGVQDAHLLDGASWADGSDSILPDTLCAFFTFRTFAHVVVRTSGEVGFRGQLDDLQGRWTTADLPQTGQLLFPVSAQASAEARQAAAHFAHLQRMVVCSQRASTAAYLPGCDACREHHAWLGDALDAAEQAMYNFDVAAVHMFFLDQMADAQNATSAHVPVAVPCHGGVDAAAHDISWTSAFVLLTRLISRIYSVDPQPWWPQLMRWVDGELAEARDHGATGLLPSFFTYGDDGEVGDATVSTGAAARAAGPPASAAHFLLCLQAMVELAGRLNDAAAADHYEQLLHTLQSDFDARFWNETLQGYGVLDLGLQTLNTLALAAGAAQGGHAASATTTLLRDVQQRNFSLTVGAAGQKHLLTALSEGGERLGAAGHEAALRLVLRREYPGWGYWVARNASACWEKWADVPGGTTYSHVWLCGGLGEWLYRDVAGIAPAAPGYTRIALAPHISSAVGPAATAARLSTVLGDVLVNWTLSAPAPGLVMAFELPVGSIGVVQLPLICGAFEPQAVLDTTAGGAAVWPLAAGAPLPPGLANVTRCDLDPSLPRLCVTAAAGQYAFEVKCG